MVNKSIFVLILIILITSAFIRVTIDFVNEQIQKQSVNVINFEECVSAGNPVMESYPRQCISKEGERFVEEIKHNQDVYTTAGGCVSAGCGDQLCVEEGADKDMISTCEFKEEYSCYKDAVCERQSNNECGWTQTEELKFCIENLQEHAFPQSIILIE